MRRSIICYIALSLSLAAIVRAEAGEHPWNNKRIYYVIENQGQLVEKGYFVRHPGSYQKKETLVVEEEKHFFGADPTHPVRSVRTRTLTTPDGRAMQRTESSLTGDDGQESITIADGDAIISASGVYGYPARVPVPDDVLFEITGEWLAGRSRQKGREFTASVLDRMTRGVISTDVRILEREPRRSYASPEIWHAEIVAPGRPPVRARYTDDGRLLRMEGGGMVFQVVGREDFELGQLPRDWAPDNNPQAADTLPEFRDEFPPRDGSPDYGDAAAAGLPSRARSRAGDAVIRIGESVPAWDSFAWLVLHGDPAYEWSNALSTSEYSRIEFNGVSTSIIAIQNAPPVDADAYFPMKVPPELQPFLSSGEIIPTVNPSVIEAAYTAVADNESRREETNVLKAVSYVAGWIHQHVALESWTGYESSALDALAGRTGDSLAHARLFCAMARTLGVPTRVCQGFLVQTGRVVNHCWAEAWINGRWIPVDTTVSRVGLPAGYVLAERGQGDGAFMFDFAGFMRTPQLRLTLSSAGRETPGGQLAELIVGNRRTYAFSEGDWMANLYWGFALRLPRSWVGQAKLNSVELVSEDRLASVKCEALQGDFNAGKAELESTVASLKANLTRFKLIESRVVSFDVDGATPALFIDFTCHEDGMNLRCRQYVIPRRQRAFRLSFWAPSDKFNKYTRDFDSILASFEF